MHSGIMQLVKDIFAAKQQKQEVGIKVCIEKKAHWLKQAKMPDSDVARYNDKDGGSIIFDVHTIELWLHFLLNKLFVTFGGELKRQHQGAPMGTNCASNLANFYLARYELCFLRNLSSVITSSTLTQAVQDRARAMFHAFLLTGRYIDDLLSINNPYLKYLLYTNQRLFHSEIHGIYPPSLSVTCTSAGTSAPYMDLLITPTPNKPGQHRLTTKVWDKREHPPLSSLFIIKFPHISSNISATAKYGIITSQFHRYRRIILWRDDFIYRMAALMTKLSRKGYAHAIMEQKVQGLCNRYPTLYGGDKGQLLQAMLQDFHKAVT